MYNIEERMHEVYANSDLARDLTPRYVKGEIITESDIFTDLSRALADLSKVRETSSIEQLYLASRIYDALVDSGAIKRY